MSVSARTLNYPALDASGKLTMTAVEVYKRDGTLQAFDFSRVERAVALCFMDLGQLPKLRLHALTQAIFSRLTRLLHERSEQAEALGVTRTAQDARLSVEEIQDCVEATLRELGEDEAATHYHDYRREHHIFRVERPLPPDAKAAFDASARYFPTPLQQYQFYDKYARFNEALGRRETWVETVDRAVDFLQDLVRVSGKYSDATYTAQEWAELREGILQMDVMPSMRLLAMAGPAAKRQHLALYNCSYLPIDDVHAFSEALLLSMSGCGVGFSVERRHVEKLPRITRQYSIQPISLTIEDTTEGWASALYTGILGWMNGKDFAFDYSQIRPAGSILKTKGGRASGPEPLRKMLAAIRAIILARQGRHLRTLDVHDMMCHVGNAAVMGGTRRTAMISLFDWDDEKMRRCKDGDLSKHEQRWNANNSAVLPDSVFSSAEQLSQIDVMRLFADMAEAGRGEPGIFNRRAAWNTMPERRRALGYHQFGTNPCFTGETQVWTINGAQRFDSLVGQSVPVLTQGDDGVLRYLPMTNIMQTRQQTPVYKVTLRSKRGRLIRREVTSSFTATPDHVIFLADGSERAVQDLRPGDSLMSAYRYTANSKGYLKLRNTSGDEVMEHRLVASYAHGKRPAYPAYHVHHKDGDKTNNAPENVEVLASADHNALNMRGANNPVNRMPESNHFRRDRYQTAGFRGRRHSEATRQQMSASHKARVNHTVVSIDYVGEQDVYDGTVEGTHRFYIVTEDGGGVLVHNCGEIILRPHGLCNLSIAVARAHDTPLTLERKVRLAARLGCIQSLATNFPGLRPIWQENAEAERLIGVDITGQRDCRWFNPDQQRSVQMLETLRTAVIQVAAADADRLGIATPAATTCVKPSGNSSVLLDCASGLHARWDKHYVRNVRVSATSPLYRVLRESGAPLAPENGQETASAPTTWVVSFPVQAPPTAVTRTELSALDQCRFWLYNKQHWTEHNPSVTITYRPDELLALAHWVWQNQQVIGGMAFLPASDAAYRLMPYVSITAEQFATLDAAFPEIDYSKLYRYEVEDHSSAASELACLAGACEVDFHAASS